MNCRDRNLLSFPSKNGATFAAPFASFFSIRIARMFSSLFRRSLAPLKRVNAQSIRRFASDAAKEEKKKSNMKLIAVLAISGPVCFCVFSYATDRRFRQSMNEKYLVYTPWLLRLFDKWFPMNTYSPYTLYVPLCPFPDS